MSNKKINGILDVFCRSLACEPLSLDDNDTCAIRYQNQLDITLALTEKKDSISFIVPILDLTGNPQTDHSPLRKLLTSCFPATALNGASLSISPYENAVVLTYVYSCEEIDELIFYNIFTNFCHLASALVDTVSDEGRERIRPRDHIQPAHIRSLLRS